MYYVDIYGVFERLNAEIAKGNKILRLTDEGISLKSTMEDILKEESISDKRKASRVLSLINRNRSKIFLQNGFSYNHTEDICVLVNDMEVLGTEEEAEMYPAKQDIIYTAPSFSVFVRDKSGIDPIAEPRGNEEKVVGPVDINVQVGGETSEKNIGGEVLEEETTPLKGENVTEVE